MKKVKTIYFDESGYTGPDLLNPDQPFFCVVSTDIEEGTAEEILKRSFPKYRGQEFKFKSIWKRPTNKNFFPSFVKELLKHEGRIYSRLDDKQFVVLTKLVDFLIEPIFTNAGYDFYANGFAGRYANTFYFVAKHFLNESQYNKLTSTYFNFSREPTASNLNTLQITLKKLTKSCQAKAKPFLKDASLGANTFHQHTNIEIFDQSNEIQLSSVLASIHHWRSKSDLDFVIIHDQSSNFFKQSQMWSKITDNNMPKQTITDGEGSSVEYPLRVVSTEPGNSKHYWAIQLCDLIAGLLPKIEFLLAHGNKEEVDFVRKIISEGLGEMIMAGVRPRSNFINEPPILRSGPDAVDQFTKIIFPN